MLNKMQDLNTEMGKKIAMMHADSKKWMEIAASKSEQLDEVERLRHESEVKHEEKMRKIKQDLASLQGLIQALSKKV